ncbi:MAG: hypothetical protein IPH88_18295 [Bacteroidales bacterium]|nr:hypothetical protein [Bacteroidales bacterium]
MKNNLEDSKLSVSPADSSFLNSLNELSATQLSIKMQQIAERNAYLESQAEALTIKLTEVVATNTKFISIIAHDLRSPFNSIIGILEILKDSLNDYNPEEIEKYINIVSESANRTLNLLDNLLVWTVSQNKEKNFNPVKVNLYNLVQDEFKMRTFSPTRNKSH